MQLEARINRHEDEIGDIRNSIHSIETDLQLLVKDHKFLAEKMQEISINIRELLTLTNDVKQSRKDILLINQEISKLKENVLHFEERFHKLDILSEESNKKWDHFINRWLRILAILIPVLTALAVIYFK